MEAELDHLTLERILSHFASDRGQDLLRAFEQQHLAAKEAEAHHGALAAAACNDLESDDGDFVRQSPIGEHVDTVMCGDDECDQWEQGRQVRGAGSECDTDGDVVMGNGETSSTPSIEHLPSSNTMGFGRLEFGFPFGAKKNPSAVPTNTASVSQPTPTPVANKVNVCNPHLPKDGRVVLVTEIGVSITDLDERGLPRGSRVVLITDGSRPYPQVPHTFEEIPTPEPAPQPRKVHSPRRNDLRESVRWRLRTFHPQLFESGELIFEPSLPQSLAKRRMPDFEVEHSAKRVREEFDAPVIVVHEPETRIEPTPVLPVMEDIMEEDEEEEEDEPPIVEPTSEAFNLLQKIAESIPLPASPKVIKTVLETAAEIPLPFVDQAVEEEELFTTPICEDYEFVESEEPEAVNGAPEVVATVPEVVDTVPEVVDIVAEIVATVPEVVPAIPVSLLLPTETPIIEQDVVFEEEEVAAVEEVSLVEEVPETHIVSKLRFAPVVAAPQSPPESPTLTPVSDYPETPKDRKYESEREPEYRIVPYIPLTPPITPMSVHRDNREQRFDFMPPRDLLTPPSPPASLIDSPLSYKGRPASPVLAIPYAPSPPPSIHQETRPSSRLQDRIGETIQEEDEDEEIEEIIRSPQMQHAPSRPLSPAPSIIDGANESKELVMMPSPLITQPASPPPSIRNFEEEEDHEEEVVEEDDSSLALTVPESPLAQKGKEKDIESPNQLVLKTSRMGSPEPIAEEDEGNQDNSYYNGNTQWEAYGDELYSPPTYEGGRPHTPGSSVGTLSRRCSAMSRMSYNTNITTPPSTRPGSAMGSTPSASGKLLMWDNGDFFDRGNSIRRELFRDATPSKKLRDSRLESLDWIEPTLPSFSKPVVKEEWELKYPLIVPPPQSFVLEGEDDEDKYELELVPQLQLLPLTRGVVYSQPILRRRRSAPSPGMRPVHRRKFRSMIEYTPGVGGEALEGINELFEDMEELSEVHDDIRNVSMGGTSKLMREITIVSEENMPLEAEETPSVMEERKRGLLKRLRSRATSIKRKVVQKVEEKKKKEKKEKKKGRFVEVV